VATNHAILKIQTTLKTGEGKNNIVMTNRALGGKLLLNMLNAEGKPKSIAAC